MSPFRHLLVFSPFLLLLLPSPSSSSPSAAVIIGGYDEARTDGIVRDEVEIFGCDGGPHALADYPFSMHGGAGLYWSGGGALVVCGGRRCEGELCQSLTDECHTLRTDGEEGGESWEPFASMTLSRWYHMLTEQPLAANAGTNVTADEEPHLIVLGYADQSDYYDPAEGAFRPYQTGLGSSGGRNWLTVNCMAEFEGLIYNWATKVEVLDPATWTWQDVNDDVPQMLYTPGRCVGTRIGGEAGIFTRQGFFYNLEREEFQPVTPPPHLPIVQAVNSIHGLDGVPVEFGVPTCDSELDCGNTLVASYDTAHDVWDVEGEMMLSRKDHVVVEVPGEFCAELGYGTPPTTQQPVTSTLTTSNTTERGGGAGGGDDAATTPVFASVATIVIALVAGRMC